MCTSVRLILAAPNDTPSEVHLHRLLDQVFHCLILAVGLDDLVANRSVERTKREIRVSSLAAVFITIAFLCTSTAEKIPYNENFTSLLSQDNCSTVRVHVKWVLSILPILYSYFTHMTT